MASHYNKKLEVTLRPLLILSQVLGFTFSNSLLLNKFKLVTACRGVVASGLAIIIFFEVPSIAGWTNRVQGTHAALAIAETRLMWIIMCFNFFVTCLYNSKINKIFVILLKFPAILKESHYKKISVYQLFIFSGTLTLGSAFYILGNDFLWHSVYNTWCTSAVYITASFYLNFSLLQFSIILYTTRQFFKALNDNLQNLNMKIDFRENWAIALSKYYKDEKIEVVKLRKLHLSLTTICRKINQCYSLQILLYFLLVLIELTYALRSLIIHISVQKDDVVSNWISTPNLEMLLTVFWISLFMWGILHIIVNCERTSSESYHSATVIHNLVNKANDKDAKKQLKLFSLQLSNCKVSFKAGRCVLLNYQLITSIIGTVLTYLTIIVTVQD